MRLRSLFVVTLVFASPAEALAKRVIYVTAGNDISWMEGYYKTHAQDGDEFIREVDGDKFTDAWSSLAAGDELILCGHGTKGAVSIEGGQYGGFKLKDATTGGTGVSCPPFELPALALDNITVTFKMCNAGSVPAGVDKKSVVQSLQPLITGANPTVTGEARAVLFGYKAVWKNSNNGTQAQRGNALECFDEQVLRDGGDAQDGTRFNKWLRLKTYAQLEALNQYLANPPCAQDVDGWTLTFTYDPPTEPQPVADGGALQRSTTSTVPVEDATDYATAACLDECDGATPARPTSWGKLKIVYR
jgi:hypothetical protein